jgi:hypothetical protein
LLNQLELNDFPSRLTPTAFLHLACTSWLPLPWVAALALGGGGLFALLAEKRLVEPDQQRRREAFFKE